MDFKAIMRERLIALIYRQWLECTNTEYMEIWKFARKDGEITIWITSEKINGHYADCSIDDALDIALSICPNPDSWQLKIPV